MKILYGKGHFELNDVLVIELSQCIRLLINFGNHVSLAASHFDKFNGNFFLSHFIECQIYLSKSALQIFFCLTRIMFLPLQVS